MMRSSTRAALGALVVALSATLASPLFAQSSAAESSTPKPSQEPSAAFRLNEALGTPEWLKISGSIRLRYEGITGQFRSAGRLKSVDHQVMARTLLRADLDFDPVGFTFELQDGRQFGAGSGSFLNTTIVNTFELLQASIQVELGEFWGGDHQIKFGRQTLDLGSRRLVARNAYRNTINSFTGLKWNWKGEDFNVEAFYFLPVVREPASFENLQSNDTVFDSEDFDQQFFGLFAAFDLGERQLLEAFAFGLVEDVGTQRELATVGGRWLRPAAKEEIDWTLEGAGQFGNSRANATGADLDHLAAFAHASIGYTFDASWKPRIRLALDFASGDDSPTDGDNNRFDTLFGARRFDYGPTGIFGAIARSNIISPEVRIEAKPAPDFKTLFAFRPVWLASDTDTWTTAGVRDPSGAAGSFVGNQIEAMVNYTILPKSLDVEVGGAYLFAGEFQEDAPNGRDRDTAYFYVQLNWIF